MRYEVEWSRPGEEERLRCVDEIDALAARLNESGPFVVHSLLPALVAERARRAPGSGSNEASKALERGSTPRRRATHTYTTTFVTCRECGHKLTEVFAEEQDWRGSMRKVFAYYECDPADLVLNNGIGRAGPNYGCGARYDRDGRRLCRHRLFNCVECMAEVSESTTVVHKMRDTFDVYIGRPSTWGNPFEIGVHGTRDGVIEKYRRHMLRRLAEEPGLRRQLEELRGKRLACWCAPLPCHGDVLLELLGTDQLP
jgi:hypothetical protein